MRHFITIARKNNILIMHVRLHVLLKNAYVAELKKTSDEFNFKQEREI